MSRRRGVGLALAAAVLFAGIASGLAVALVTRDDGDDAVEAVREAAGRFAEVFNTYDHNDIDAHRDGVLALSTGSFRSEYADAFDQGLGDLIQETQATQQAFLKDVYVSAVDEERAQAIVTVDITHTGTSGSRTVRDVYSLLTFVEVEDGWKVDQVTDLNFAVATGEAGLGGSVPSTSTTATTVTASGAGPVP